MFLLFIALQAHLQAQDLQEAVALIQVAPTVHVPAPVPVRVPAAEEQDVHLKIFTIPD